MKDGRAAWAQVAERFEMLGQDLSRHFDMPIVETRERRAFETALRRLTRTLERGLVGMADSVRDTKVRKDTLRVASSLQDAIGASLTDVQKTLVQLRGQRKRTTTRPKAATRRTTAPKTTARKSTAPRTTARKTAAPKTAMRTTTGVGKRTPTGAKRTTTAARARRT